MLEAIEKSLDAIAFRVNPLVNGHFRQPVQFLFVAILPKYSPPVDKSRYLSLKFHKKDAGN
jgi:hypothetical protein